LYVCRIDKKIKKEKDIKKPKKRKSSAYEDSEDEKPLVSSNFF